MKSKTKPKKQTKSAAREGEIRAGIAGAVAGRLKAARGDATVSAFMRSDMPPGGPVESMVRRYEYGDNIPSIEALCFLALAHGVEPGDLLPSLAELPGLLKVVPA